MCTIVFYFSLRGQSYLHCIYITFQRSTPPSDEPGQWAHGGHAPAVGQRRSLAQRDGCVQL